MEKKTNLIKIPGVGEKTKQDLIALGYPNLESLKEVDPEVLYEQDCTRRNIRIDRCQLYVYRYLVYCANHIKEEYQEKRWWNFKD